jgi:hypothetical protein
MKWYVAAHFAWLQSHALDPADPLATGRSFAYVTCGDWDLKTCLPGLLLLLLCCY